MDTELNERHRQVLGLEKLRSKRHYREGWLYHVCLQKGLLEELRELQMAGLVGDAPRVERNPTMQAEPEVGVEFGEDGEMIAPRTRLTVELVPRTCWFSNLRSELSKEDWDRLRGPVLDRAGRRCEICGGRGIEYPVECHEVWEYDDAEHVQRLAGLVALCPACHEAKHMGYATSQGRGGQARAHLARVNRWSMEMAELYLEGVFEQWSRRSQHEWTLDLSWLRQLGVDVTPGR